jgi:hypothetical protein
MDHGTLTSVLRSDKALKQTAMNVAKAQVLEVSGRFALTLLVTLNIIYFGLRYDIGPLVTGFLAVALGLAANLFWPPK